MRLLLASLAPRALNSGLLGSGPGQLLCSSLCQRWVHWSGAVPRLYVDDGTGQEIPDPLTPGVCIGNAYAV